jgi:peptidoglycan/xylan/chitin deacetylase (PgdA/CDA1 family)
MAVWVIPNVEYFPFDLPSTPINPACTHLVPDVLNFSWRDYGTRVGIWRIMDAMDEAGVRGTAAVNALVCDYFPEFIEEAMKRGWEFMGHGLTNARGLGGMDEETEKETIRGAIEKLALHTGKAPKGWLGPALAETMRTPDLLKEAGLEYVCDWVNDDQPYYMRTAKGPLVAMPYTLELNDIQMFLRGGCTPEEYYRALMDQFEVLYEEGAKTARIMGISLHPFILGVAYRSKYFRRALLEIASFKDVWLATGSEIASWFKEAVPLKEV